MNRSFTNKCFHTAFDANKYQMRSQSKNLSIAIYFVHLYHSTMNTVACTNCGTLIEITQAIKQQIEQEILQQEKNRHQQELKQVKKDAEEQIAQKIQEEFEFKLKDSEKKEEETRKRVEHLMQNLLKAHEENRILLQQNEEREIEMQKKLLEERAKLQEEISKKAQEKAKFEKLELEKRLEDMKKALEEAQRKSQQKSGQLQGEVLELELEQTLKTQFPQDDIEPVGKGITGADVVHVVKSPKGYTCGVILWESKRTKEWSDKWIGKLKEDLRSEKANVPVIVSIALPQEASNGLGIKDGVWICSNDLVIPLAILLRTNLLDVGYQKAVSLNRGTKADQLYAYITSHEFKQQIENVVEVYNEMQRQIVKERVVFEKAWKQREAQAQRIILSTASLYGTMQGKVGAAMPQIKGLEVQSLDEGEASQIDLLENKDDSAKTYI